MKWMFELLVFYLGFYTVSHERWRAWQRRCRKKKDECRQIKNKMWWEDLTKTTGVRTETNTVCLLFMGYCSDKGYMPGRHPGALSPVFTSQIRHNVHKLVRAPRWCHLLSNHLKSAQQVQGKNFTTAKRQELWMTWSVAEMPRLPLGQFFIHCFDY